MGMKRHRTDTFVNEISTCSFVFLYFFSFCLSFSFCRSIGSSISIIPISWRTVFGSSWTIYISINVALYTVLLFLSIWQSLCGRSKSSFPSSSSTATTTASSSSSSLSSSIPSPSSSSSSSPTENIRHSSPFRSSWKLNFRSLSLGILMLASLINILWLIDPFGFEHVYPVSLRSGIELIPYSLTFLCQGFMIALWKRITWASAILQRIQSKVTIGKYKYTLLCLGFGLLLTIILNVLLTENLVDNFISTCVIRSVYLFCTVNFTLWGSIYGLQFIYIILNKPLPSFFQSCFRYLVCCSTTTASASHELSESGTDNNPSTSATTETEKKFRLPSLEFRKRSRTSSSMVTHRRDMRNRPHASSSMSGISLPNIGNTKNINQDNGSRLSTASFTTTASTMTTGTMVPTSFDTSQRKTSMSIATLINSSLTSNNSVTLRHGSVLDAIIGHQSTDNGTLNPTTAKDSSVSTSLPYDEITRTMESRGIPTSSISTYSGRIIPSSTPVSLESSLTTTKNAEKNRGSSRNSNDFSLPPSPSPSGLLTNRFEFSGTASFMDTVIITRFIWFVGLLFVTVLTWFILFCYIMVQRYIGPWEWFAYFCVSQFVQLIADVCIVQLLWLRRPGINCLSFLFLHRSSTVDELRVKAKVKAKLLDIWDDLQTTGSTLTSMKDAGDTEDHLPRDDEIHNLSFFGLLKRAFGPRRTESESVSSNPIPLNKNNDGNGIIDGTLHSSVLQNPLNYEANGATSPTVPSSSFSPSSPPETGPPQPVFMRLQDVLASPELTARIMSAQMREFERLQAEHIVTQTELRQVINLSAKEAVARMATNTTTNDGNFSVSPSTTTTTTVSTAGNMGSMKYQSPTVQHVVHNPLRSLPLFTPITATSLNDTSSNSTVSPSSPSVSTNSSPSPTFDTSGDPATDATIKAILQQDKQQNPSARRGYVSSSPSSQSTTDDGLPAPFLQWLINEWPSTNNSINNNNNTVDPTGKTTTVPNSMTLSSNDKESTDDSSPENGSTTIVPSSPNSFVFGGVRPELYKRVEIKPKSFDISSVALQDNDIDTSESDDDNDSSDNDTYENIVQRYISKALGGGKSVPKHDPMHHRTTRPGDETNGKNPSNNSKHGPFNSGDNGMVRRVWNGKEGQTNVQRVYHGDVSSSSSSSSSSTTTNATPVVEVIKGDLTLSVNVALASAGSSGTGGSVGTNPSIERKKRSEVTNEISTSSSSRGHSTDNAVPNPFRVLAAAVRAHHQSKLHSLNNNSSNNSNHRYNNNNTSTLSSTTTGINSQRTVSNLGNDNFSGTTKRTNDILGTVPSTDTVDDNHNDDNDDDTAAMRRKERQVQLIHNLRVHGLPVPSSLEDSLQTASLNAAYKSSPYDHTSSTTMMNTFNPDDFGAGILLSENSSQNNNNNNSPSSSTAVFMNTPSPLTLGLIGNPKTNPSNRGISSSSSSSSMNTSSRSERSRSVA